jgi:hypothetical protein
MTATTIARHAALALLTLAVARPAAVLGAPPPCAPCAGVQVPDPAAAAAAIATEPRLEDDAPLWIAWRAALDGSADAAASAPVRAAGAIPWRIVTFRAPQPIRENVDALQAELADLARLARGAGPDEVFQIGWEPSAGVLGAEDFAFLIKRASVAVTGASDSAAVWIGPLAAADIALIDALWQREDIAPYVDGVALAPGEGIEPAIARLVELDPGKPVALDALPWPAPPEYALSWAAQSASGGVSITFFAATTALDATALAPLKTLAREFKGDLSYDPYTAIGGVERAWAFVRGEDLSLRVIAETPAGAADVRLELPDPLLRDPQRVDLLTGTAQSVPGAAPSDRALTVPVAAPGPVTVLRVARASVTEIGGEEERLDVADERSMPVEEILRRLQAFEDDQARKLTHYQARNILHLRFQAGAAGIEAAYAGDFFFERGKGFDWVWEEFLVDGVKWRSKRLPEIPLIQPEKAAALPLEILFTKDYQYTLRGTATIDGRDTWVVDFRPIEATVGRNLYQGTVWVDREVYARVRTRALQLGLEGEVLSNEETTFFRPIDAQGQPAPWSRESFVLPTRVVSQQLLSILNATVPLETETELSDLRLNDPSFAANREAAWASELTMVRDTEEGLRYLRSDESGDRVVEREMDTDRLFVVGGVFWDESVDYPIPLAGVNYLALDFRRTGNQVNLFAAGPLLTLNYAEPRLAGSKWDAGFNLFGFFIDRTDEIFRDQQEVPAEEIDSRTASASFYLGHPIGSFAKLDFGYRYGYDKYSRGDDTAEDFVLPNDGGTHSVSTELRYDRSGYRARFAGSYHTRSDWEPWGLEGSTEFDPEQEDYLRWSARFEKNWWLEKFRTIGVQLTYVDGQDLDRFSRYDFGIFGDLSIPGYQGGLVRADQAAGMDVGYGLSFGELLRFEIEAVGASVTNEEAGLEDEVLGGVGLEGSLPLPWQVLTNFELGIGVAGPGEGDLAARIVFLKLFGGEGNKRKKRADAARD